MRKSNIFNESFLNFANINVWKPSRGCEMLKDFKILKYISAVVTRFWLKIYFIHKYLRIYIFGVTKYVSL